LIDITALNVELFDFVNVFKSAFLNLFIAVAINAVYR